MIVANAERIKELVESGVIPESAVQALIDEWDPIIRVDRSVRPEYPDFVKEVKHPEFELMGPAEFDVTKLGLWLHPEQKNVVSGNNIYECLKENNMLGSCCNLADLKAIQSRGIGFFRKHFPGKYLPAWASVVLDHWGDLNVPSLYEDGDEVNLDWDWLDNDFRSDEPALCRAS